MTPKQKDSGAAVQVKICGIRDPGHAALCAEHGACAVGCVFYPKSPRCIDPDRAREIAAAVQSRIPAVGVFVDAGQEQILRIRDRCGIQFAQLHGTESPALVERLLAEGMTVIKTLFATRDPLFADAECYRPSGFLVECGRGFLPGGNAEAWEWSAASVIDRRRPLLLAGGLHAGNVRRAIQQARPDGVDVSSGVESSPGVKDPERIRSFLQAVAACVPETPTRRMFP
ncbi:MAG: phosphoribosylanthranilate isomerase [Desulfobacteraceae bacterium]|nr:phosphoribosylanthranilate isomerase [Desulfobacteraceae bacterium]